MDSVYCQNIGTSKYIYFYPAVLSNLDDNKLSQHNISYSSDSDIDSIMDCLRYNDYQDEDSDFLNAALIYGVAAELMYTDEQGQVRFRLIEPTSCFGVYDDSLTGDLMYFVRWYKANDWDDSDLYNVDVYGDTAIKHYQMHGTQGGLQFVSEEPHYFNQCPANILIARLLTCKRVLVNKTRAMPLSLRRLQIK